MLLLSRMIKLAIILVAVAPCSVGNQRIIHVSELISDDEGFFTNDEDDNSHLCCVYGNCTCNSLDHALANLTSNVLINITTDVTLSSLIKRSGLRNVSIIGHSICTVNCKHVGAIHFNFCHNFIIQDITWDGCGTKLTNNLTEPAVKLNYSFNVTIQNCSFQHSIGQALVLSEVSGDVNINNCNFVNNSHYRGHGAAIHYLYRYNTKEFYHSQFAFTIHNCNFTNNKHVKSLVYVKNRLLEYHKIIFNNSVFSYNEGISVYALNHKIYINGKVLFQNNVAEDGAGIYISNHSTVIFDVNSNVTFYQNFADIRGGAVFLSKYSLCLFDNKSIVTFDHNKAIKGGAVYSEDNSNVTLKENYKVIFTSNSATQEGAAIYSSDHSHIIYTRTTANSSTILYSRILRTMDSCIDYSNNSFHDRCFEGNFNVVFFNNTAYIGGAIYCEIDCNISFEIASKIMFVNNSADFGGAICCYRNSCISFKGNSTTVFSNNNAKSGGVIYSALSINISFEGNSVTEFSHNNAQRGGAMDSDHNSYICFEGNSVTEFSHNTAVSGGAIHSNDTSYISFEENSVTEFIENTADYYGGAMYSCNGYVSYQGSSVTVFSNNTASIQGGAVIVDQYSYISFKGNSTTVFSNNTSTYGGAINSRTNSYMFFEGNCFTRFINNTGFNAGAAIRSEDNSNVLFQGNSCTVFSNNKANHSGGAINSIGNSCLSFEGNSITMFSGNSADYGQSISSRRNSYTYFKGDSAIMFSDSTSANCDKAFYFDYKRYIICKGNSTEGSDNAVNYGGTLLKNNTETMSKTIFCFRDSKIIVEGHSNVVFNEVSARWCMNACLPYPTADTVMIDNNGIVWCSNVKAFNCSSDKCYCKDLSKKFEDVKNNQVVNITDKIVLLSSVIHIISHYNVTIIGHNNPTVICVNDSGVEIESSNNLTIKGITLIGCGATHAMYPIYIPVLEITDSNNVTIQKCSFLYSLGQVVSITTLVASEYMDITDCTFVNSIHYREHGMAIFIRITFPEFLEFNHSVFTLKNCDFRSNRGAKSVILITQYGQKFKRINVYLINSSFSNNQGTSIYLENYYNLHVMGEVLFQNNEAEDGAGIYISDHSTVMFGENSNTKFINNSVYHNGAAISLNDNSSVIFDDNSIVKFYHNKAHNGIVYSNGRSSVMFKATCKVTFSNNTAAQYGAAIYSFDSSQVVFTGNSTVTLNNNFISFHDAHLQHGGTILSKSNSILVFEENSVILFSDNTADIGTAIFSIHNSNVIFKDSSRVMFNNNIAHYCGILTSGLFSNITFTDHTKVTYGMNTVSYILSRNDESSAGIICTFQRSEIIFTEHSLVTFVDNKADRGGAVIIFECNVIMEKYSTIVFNNNFALYSFGGAFVCSNNSNVTIKGNSNVTFNNNKASQSGGAIHSYNMCRITFKDNSTSTFTSNTARDNGGGIFSTQLSEITFQGNSSIIFDGNIADYGGGLHCDKIIGISFSENTKITFQYNRANYGGAIFTYHHSDITVAGKSVLVFLNNEAIQSGGAGYFNYSCNIIIKETSVVTFNYNKAFQAGAVCINDRTKFTIKGNATASFYNNIGTVGGGSVKLLTYSSMGLNDNITVKFINNNAQYGGAIFLDITAVMVNRSYKNCINFTDNIAKVSGNSVYQDVAMSCNSSYLSDRLVGISSEYIATPPNELRFYDPAICIDGDNDTQCNNYYVKNIMLGTEIVLPACVVDYYNQSIDSTHFLVQGETYSNYFFSGPKQIFISCDDTFEGISILGNQRLSQSVNFSIYIRLNIALNSNWKQVMVNLTIELSPCHPGFWQYPKSTACECYNASDIVFCSGSSSTIKRGYWFGSVTGKPTIAFCLIDYCNFTCCETSNGYYHLSPVRDNQCRSHRSGIACGSCEEGYTLSFDSVECVHVNECSIGWTILVLALVVLYWIIIILAVFSLMHFKVEIGYLYAMTYYYSVVDILLSQNWYQSDALYTTINIMSSVGNIIPQFLGHLCFITNMSGIDQQFIHYIHPVAISLFLVMITVLARRSHRLSSIISKGIIRVICCLLLLSYTSLATTSLLLLRPLIFHDVDKVYTYVSPDVEYFHGRHLVYGIVASVFTIVIVIGLPLLLALEPFLNSKINFIRIKPLLDQFQGCYKDKYRCFAAYYMICRLTIITIILINSFNDLLFQYLLIIVCMVTAILHQLFRPYSSSLLNKFDGYILQVLVLVSAPPLSKFHDNFDSSLVVGITFILVILPSLVFITISLMMNKEKFEKLLRYCYNKCLQLWEHNEISPNEIPLIVNEGSSEFYNIIDDSKRINATICDM